MSKADMISAILLAIQDDAQLKKLMLTSISANLPNLEVDRLTMLMSVLGLPTDPPAQ